jgi:hypothetical protein
MDDRDEWIARNAAAILGALRDATVRAEVLAQLGADDSGLLARRRAAAARRELRALGLLDDDQAPERP